MLFIIILNILYASTFTIGKLLLNYSGPVFITGLRMTLGGLSLLAYSLIVKKEKIKKIALTKQNLIDIAQIIILGNFISYVFDFVALKYTSSIKVSFLYNLTPFISAIFSYFMLHEKINLKKWAGLIISFIGCLPILIEHSQDPLISDRFFISWPEILLIISVATYAYSWILMRKMINYENQSPIIVNYLTMFLGGLLTFPTSWLFETRHPITDLSNFLFLLFLIILAGNIVFYNFYGALLKKYTVTFIAISSLMCPLFTAIFGKIFLGEQITLSLFISNLTVFLGLYIYYQEEKQEK